MISRILFISLLVVTLLGLIAYSQLREEPRRVSGIIEADEIRVGSRVGGRILTVLVSEGQRVRQGEPLLQLEPYDLLDREREAEQSLAALEADYRRLQAGFRPEEIAQAKAKYEQYRARYDLLVQGPRPQEIEAARGRLQLAESELVLAQQDYDRNMQLIDQNAISQAELDATVERMDVARAMVIVRKQELDLLNEGTREEEKREAKARVDEAEQAWLLAKNGYRSEEVDRAKAARDAAAATLATLGEQKKELTVTSPLDGVIEALDLQKGDLVPAGAPVLSIMDDQHLWVRAYVPQNRVGLRVGQLLDVTVDSLPEQRFQGEITFIARQAEFTPSNVQTFEERSKQVFRIKVDLPADSDQIRPGMTVDVWLDTADASR